MIVLIIISLLKHFSIIKYFIHILRYNDNVIPAKICHLYRFSKGPTHILYLHLKTESLRFNIEFGSNSSLHI